MTANELMALAHANPMVVGGGLAAPVLLSALLQLTPPLVVPRGPLAVLWSTIVYAACVPGIFAISVLAYNFLMRFNLMNLDLFITLGPIASMTTTLFLVGRKCVIGDLPGVDRLGGLLTMLAVTCLAVIFIEKTRIFVLFTGSVWTLLILAVGLFVAFKIGAARVFGRRDPIG